jgi:dCTP diphosphatase
MADINKLIEAVVAFREARDWKQFHNPKDLSISLVLEATEVLEHFQWKNAEEMAKHVKEHKEDVAEELADTLYWVLLLANDLDIDISEAFTKKIEKNNQKYPVDKASGNHRKYTEL